MKSAGGSLTVLVVCFAGALQAATLERLSLDDMVAKSTEIVRGKAVASSAGFRGAPFRGGTVYTHYTVEVTERWKGGGATRIDVAVPGGVAQGIRQTFPGAPSISLNTEYVFFLWTGRSGLTQIIGLSQGLLNVKVGEGGKVLLTRSASSEPMVDAAGNPVADRGLSMSLSAVRSAVSSGRSGGRK